MADAVMLFAAGFGTRMGALTADRPKPLLAVGGRTLLDHALALTEAIPRRVVNAHYRAEQIAAHLEGRPRVALSHEAGEILETGGGLKAALPLLAADPVFTLNTDVVWTGPNPLETLARAWDPARMEALLLLVAQERARSHAGAGDFEVAADGRLTRGRGAIYAGAQILRTGPLAEIPDRVFSLNRVWDVVARRGGLYGVLHPGHWCDVGRPEGIAAAEAMLADVR